MHMMEMFLNNSNLEIEVRCNGRQLAQQMARMFQAMLYLQDISASLMPFFTSHSYNSYSGINSRDSIFDSHREALPEGLREGFTSNNATVEAWLHDPSLWCMHSGGSTKITEEIFQTAEQDFHKWSKLESQNKTLKIPRLALQTAPVIPHDGSSLLHIWQGIEAIFNVSTEVTFRTSLLIAQLASNLKPPSETYQLAKKSYGIRSKAVHGNVETVGQKEWQDAWYLLTLVTKAIILRDGLPSADDLINELLGNAALKASL